MFSITPHTKCNSGVMDQHCESNYTVKSNALVKTQMKETDDKEKPNKCNQCTYSSCRQFEDTLQNAQWRQDKQMQPM